MGWFLSSADIVRLLSSTRKMAPFIWSVLPLLLITVFLSTTVNAQPHPSAVPRVCYTCPKIDLDGNPFTEQSVSTSTIYCQIAKDKFCAWNSETGKLQDSKGAKCQAQAAATICPKKRGLPEILRSRQKARAAQPQLSELQPIALRGTLGKKKRAPSGAK